MPVSPCFSYPADAPPGNEMCFSKPDDVPNGGGDHDAVQPSLSDVRRMPGGACFRY